MSIVHTRGLLRAAVVRSGSSAPLVVSLPLGDADLEELLTTYRLEVDPVGVELGPETWDAPLRPLMAELAEAAAGAAEIVVSPHRELHTLPWPVLFARSVSRTADGAEPAVVVEPALPILASLLRRPLEARTTVAVFGDPGGDLPYSRSEAESVARTLEVEPSTGERATRSAVLEALGGAQVVHLACHAGVDVDAPLASYLELVDGRLTARELLHHRLGARLVVLSACDSGRGVSGGGDEFIGLVYALLQGGVQSIVASLWPVPDHTTAHLMSSFHRRSAQGQDITGALRDAAREVRDAGHDHAFYWGAFVVIGRP